MQFKNLFGVVNQKKIKNIMYSIDDQKLFSTAAIKYWDFSQNTPESFQNSENTPKLFEIPKIHPDALVEAKSVNI